ncbi:DUF4124 domain-containing protein [Kineococcus sp. SYSU DK001]|uniref:DUF4124 domain-containing protein n=1 Tax=Kineococcus sp. SYSU DK001 TaxID=3383122 RepID=UPI003D7E4F4F
MRKRSALLATVSALAAVALSTPTAFGAGTSVIADQAPRGGVFGATSEWKRNVSAAPLAANSAELVANVQQQVAAYYGAAAFNVNKYGTSIYTVDATQPRIDLAWDNCQRKPKMPAGILGEGGQFTQVPIPADAVPAAGTDGQLTIYSPQTDQLWEFWKAKKVDGKWQACWGGRIDSLSTNPGYFSGYWGASASGLAVTGGSLLIADAQAGVIDHALSLQLVNVRDRSVVSYPAQRSDGLDASPNVLAEGQRLRLDPSVNVDALKITPLAKMVAKAAQKYGFIVTDKAGAVAITAESPSAVIADTGVNPWTAIMAGKKSYDIFRGFPWDKVQALPLDYGKPAPVTTTVTTTTVATR